MKLFVCKDANVPRADVRCIVSRLCQGGISGDTLPVSSCTIVLPIQTVYLKRYSHYRLRGSK